MSVTQLRANLYKVVDEVLATGIPQRIVRGNDAILLQPEKKKTKSSSKKRWDFDNLPGEKIFLGTESELKNLTGWDEAAQKEWNNEWGEFSKKP